MRVIHFFDYKSPYAYLVQADARALETECGAELVLLPYTLSDAEFASPSPDAMATDRDAPARRRRARYVLRDCKREATRRGLPLVPPPAPVDSADAHVAFLYARRQGDPRAFHDALFDRFWRRSLDLGDLDVLCQLLSSVGLDAAGFPSFLEGAGRAEYARLEEWAHEAGVFGVPSFLVGNELFYGMERIPHVREALEKL
ncbi:MAG: DsbA family protein [Myxococcota bacterium]